MLVAAKEKKNNFSFYFMQQLSKNISSNAVIEQMHYIIR